MTEDEDNGKEFNYSREDDNEGEEIKRRLKHFAYYLTQSVETNFSFCLNLLEGRALPKKSNSTPATAVSLLTTQIPVVGRGVSATIKESEIFILDRIDKENAKSLANLVYFFSDNKHEIRQTLIHAAIDIFLAFQHQFAEISLKTGTKRAMQKMALDASSRIMGYLLERKLEAIGREDIGRGLLSGSYRNKLGQKFGRTVIFRGSECRTHEIYSRPGVFSEGTKHQFLTGKNCRPEIFGFRRLFAWEGESDVCGYQICENVADEFRFDSDECESRLFSLAEKNPEEVYEKISEYITNQDENEAAQYDRERKHAEALGERQRQHEETIRSFNEKFSSILEMLTTQFDEITNLQKETQAEILAIRNAKRDEAAMANQEQLEKRICNIQKKVDRVEDNQSQACAGAAKVIKSVDVAIKQVQSEYKRTEPIVKGVVEGLKKSEKDVKKLLKFKKWK